MTISLKHNFTSPVVDEADPNEVGPSEWNAEHNLTQATARVLGRVTAGTGATEELTAAQVRTLINVEDGATADQSAAEILTALLTVDGAGSGLDADLLDGSSSAAFQPIDADLTTIAGLTATSDNFMQSKASAWASRTPTQVTADLINFVGDVGAGGTKGLVPAPAAGDAAAAKFLKADATWATAGGAPTGAQYLALAADATLTAERVFTAGNGVRAVDAGAGAAYTVHADGFNMPVNLGLAVSAAAGALTIALKGADGNDPSATNPVKIPFQHQGVTTGTPQWRSVEAATSLVLSSGSTLGVTSSTAFRIWVVAFDDGGTIKLGAINCSTATQIYPLNDGLVASPIAEGGAGAADSAGVFYTASAATSKPYRILGFIEWNGNGLTAGTWTTTDLNFLRLFGPGVKKPGDIVQSIYATDTTATTATSTTKVQTTTTASITPSSAANLILARASGNLTSDSSSQIATAQLSRGAGPTMIGSIGTAFSVGGVTWTGACLEALDKPNVTDAQAYYVYLWASGAVNVHWLKAGFSSQVASIVLTELMG